MDWNGQTKKPPPDFNIDEFFQEVFNNPRKFFLFLLVILLAFAGWSGFYIVETNERGVVTRFGEYLKLTKPGANLKLPFGIDQVTKVKTELINQESFGFALGGSRGRRGRNYKEESLMLTGDLNVVDVQWVIHYRITNPREYLFNVRDPIKNVRDISQAIMRRIVGDLTATEVLTVQKEAIEAEAKLLTQEVLDLYQMGVFVEEVKLQDVFPPERVKPAFNEVNSAKQEKERLKNLAEQEYNKIIPKASGEKARKILDAEGYAGALMNRARGDATKIKQVIKQFKLAPEVTQTRMYLDLFQDISKRLQGITLVDPKIKGVLPIWDTQTQTALTSKQGGGK